MDFDIADTTLKLSRRELQTVFHVGRKLRLVDCLMGKTDKPRTVKAHKSYGYDMLTDDGKTSRLDFQKGDYILGDTCGLGFHHVSIFNNDGKLCARYEVL